MSESKDTRVVPSHMALVTVGRVLSTEKTFKRGDVYKWLLPTEVLLTEDDFAVIEKWYWMYRRRSTRIHTGFKIRTSHMDMREWFKSGVKRPYRPSGALTKRRRKPKFQ